MGDAGIGAAGTLGVVLALTGIGLLTTHMRRRPHLPVGRHWRTLRIAAAAPRPESGRGARACNARAPATDQADK
jgi:hypothetical protein